MVVEPPGEHEQVARDRLADGAVVDARAVREDHVVVLEHLERESIVPRLDRVDPVQFAEGLAVREGDDRVAGVDVVVDHCRLDRQVGKIVREYCRRKHRFD